MDLHFLWIIAILTAAIGTIVSSRYFHAQEDNVVEEVVESLIEKEFGARIDLTPDSKEGK